MLTARVADDGTQHVLSARNSRAPLNGQTRTRTRVVHVTSHHNVKDGRVFYRECRSLARAGYDVSLIVPHTQDEPIDGVAIRAISRGRRRVERFTITAWRAIRRALAEKPAIFHLHDPELLPWGLALRAMGKNVIFDVHEDFAQASTVREWIPQWLRKPVALGYGQLAALARRSFTIVIAEKYYSRNFPQSTSVLNYPDLHTMADLLAIKRDAPSSDKARLIYVGSVTRSRGAMLHAQLAQSMPGAEIHLVGRCDPELAEEICRECQDLEIRAINEAGETSIIHRPKSRIKSTLVFQGIGSYVSPETIKQRLAEDWTAALAIFPYSEHYYEKELTKFFEYMVAGLPTIASDFPVWRQLLEGTRTGICVDPDNLKQAAQQIQRLRRAPKNAAVMGSNGRLAVRTKFNWASENKKLVQLYDDIIARQNSQLVAA